MMDSLSDAGPMFAAKLNEVGVKLSQAGKAKSALVLYQKAHKIVRNELKYKLSMNAALACHRLGDYDLALKFLARCQKEYGSSFPKLEKIRGAVTSAKAQQAKVSVGKPAAAPVQKPATTTGAVAKASVPTKKQTIVPVPKKAS
jgi:tetratricopeptide (TPR) repeat protein